MADRRARGAAPAPAARDARDHPAGGVRPRGGPDAGSPARPAHRGARLHREPAVGAPAVAAAAALDPDPAAASGSAARRPTRSSSPSSRSAAARWSATATARRATTSWPCCWPPAIRTDPDVRAGAARRAHDGARGRPRDDRVAAGLGAGAPGPRACRPRAPHRRARRGRVRRVPQRHDHRDPAPAAGAAQRRASADQARGGDRRAPLPAGRGADGQRLSHPPRSRHLPRAARVPARAL